MSQDLALIQQTVKKYLDEAIALSESLYDHPEISCEEVESSRKIVEILTAAGFQVEYPFMEKELGYGTAFRAVLKNGEGPSAAIMVEYDALPGLGHACGHNLHGALSVLSGLVLADLKDCFQGTLYVIGTPAEEESGAKITMAEQGAFDDMALAIMMHSWSGGKSLCNMPALSLRGYLVEFFGQEAHAAASPWEGRSALAAARKYLDLIDARRECFTSDIRVNSIILSGGDAPNIIPGYAKVRTEFRTDSHTKLEVLDEAVRKCAGGAAMALDCDVTFKKCFPDFWDMIRLDSLEEEMENLMAASGESMVAIKDTSGSSDVGNVSYRCPAIQPHLCITDASYSLHTDKFREATKTPQAYQAMERGAQVIVQMVLKIMNDDAYRQKVLQEFHEKTSK